jgi:hypothetical protein
MNELLGLTVPEDQQKNAVQNEEKSAHFGCNTGDFGLWQLAIEGGLARRSWRAAMESA